MMKTLHWNKNSIQLNKLLHYKQKPLIGSWKANTFQIQMEAENNVYSVALKYILCLPATD